MSLCCLNLHSNKILLLARPYNIADNICFHFIQLSYVKRRKILCSSELEFSWYLRLPHLIINLYNYSSKYYIGVTLKVIILYYYTFCVPRHCIIQYQYQMDDPLQNKLRREKRSKQINRQRRKKKAWYTDLNHSKKLSNTVYGRCDKVYSCVFMRWWWRW